jgi:eukaryotic-like serine/threonine-protein kinase
LIGTILGEKYRIARRIGSGGMGIVYEAEQIDTGQPVAVKLIHSSLIAMDEDGAMVTRFEREARAAGAIESPHIARVFDVGTDPESGYPFMVMEYLVGEDAHQLFERLGPVTPDLALRIAAQSCLGLSKAHEARVIHRDIKPANLFLARGEEGERVVKLLDFGVAKVRGDPGDSGAFDGLTHTGSMIGSPMYMSPEQARSARLVDRRSDIWSIGMVLYRALAGRTPYQNIRGIGAMVLALYSDLPPLVQYFAPWVSPQITAIVDRALRIDPDQRFQTMDEMLDAIRPLLPDGFAIDDSMLEPLSEEARESLAPVFIRGTPNVSNEDRAPMSARSPSGKLSSFAPPPMGPLSAGPVSSDKELAMTAVSPSDRHDPKTPSPLSKHARTEAASEVTHASATPRRSSAVPMVAIVMTSVALGGISVYALTRPVSKRPPPSAEASVLRQVPPPAASSAEPSELTVPVGSASASASASAAAPPSASAFKPDRRGVFRGSDRGKPAGSGKSKDPPRLDHTSFGDRK